MPEKIPAEQNQNSRVTPSTKNGILSEHTKEVALVIFEYLCLMTALAGMFITVGGYYTEGGISIAVGFVMALIICFYGDYRSKKRAQKNRGKPHIQSQAADSHSPVQPARISSDSPVVSTSTVNRASARDVNADSSGPPPSSVVNNSDTGHSSPPPVDLPLVQSAGVSSDPPPVVSTSTVNRASARDVNADSSGPPLSSVADNSTPSDPPPSIGPNPVAKGLIEQAKESTVAPSTSPQKLQKETFRRIIIKKSETDGTTVLNVAGTKIIIDGFDERPAPKRSDVPVIPNPSKKSTSSRTGDNKSSMPKKSLFSIGSAARREKSSKLLGQGIQKNGSSPIRGSGQAKASSGRRGVPPSRPFRQGAGGSTLGAFKSLASADAPRSLNSPPPTPSTTIHDHNFVPSGHPVSPTFSKPVFLNDPLLPT